MTDDAALGLAELVHPRVAGAEARDVRVRDHAPDVNAKTAAASHRARIRDARMTRASFKRRNNRRILTNWPPEPPPEGPPPLAAAMTSMIVSSGRLDTKSMMAQPVR